MAKKMDEAEVKKECPSCGLGVALDATICEFCGWDFEEEDEWILQIEKLERDLMLEKQKFAPGTVNHMIETTLHTPALERIEAIKSASKPPAEAAPVKEAKAPATATAPAPQRPVSIEPAASAPSASTVEPERPRVRRVRTVKAGTGGVAGGPEGADKVRRVRIVRPGDQPEEQPGADDEDKGIMGGFLSIARKDKEKVEEEPKKPKVAKKLRT